MRFQGYTLAVVVAALGLALLAGSHARGALVGVATSGAAGLASIRAMGRFAGRGERVIQPALAVITVGFLLRIVLVALGTILVVRTGQSIPGFVTAFFVVYFVLAGVEAAYVRTLGRQMEPRA